MPAGVDLGSNIRGRTPQDPNTPWGRSSVESKPRPTRRRWVGGATRSGARVRASSRPRGETRRAAGPRRAAAPPPRARRSARGLLEPRPPQRRRPRTPRGWALSWRRAGASLSGGGNRARWQPGGVSGEDICDARAAGPSRARPCSFRRRSACGPVARTRAHDPSGGQLSLEDSQQRVVGQTGPQSEGGAPKARCGSARCELVGVWGEPSQIWGHGAETWKSGFSTGVCGARSKFGNETEDPRCWKER